MCKPSFSLDVSRIGLLVVCIALAGSCSILPENVTNKLPELVLMDSLTLIDPDNDLKQVGVITITGDLSQEGSLTINWSGDTIMYMCSIVFADAPTFTKYLFEGGKVVAIHNQRDFFPLRTDYLEYNEQGQLDRLTRKTHGRDIYYEFWYSDGVVDSVGQTEVEFLSATDSVVQIGFLKRLDKTGKYYNFFPYDSTQPYSLSSAKTWKNDYNRSDIDLWSCSTSSIHNVVTFKDGCDWSTSGSTCIETTESKGERHCANGATNQFGLLAPSSISTLTELSLAKYDYYFSFMGDQGWDTRLLMHLFYNHYFREELDLVEYGIGHLTTEIYAIPSYSGFQ